MDMRLAEKTMAHERGGFPSERGGGSTLLTASPWAPSSMCEHVSCDPLPQHLSLVVYTPCPPDEETEAHK